MDLSYLGLVGPVPLTADALARLTRAQVERVPFESISAIVRRAATGPGPVPPLDPVRLRAEWAAQRAGGVCFAVATGFGALLRDLGFEVQPVNATISWPGSHQALVVVVDGRRYLVDAGNGAPFAEPLPLDGPVEIRRAGLAYRFRPGAADQWVQDRWIDGAWAPFCVYELGPDDPEVRARAYQHHHTPGQSWVVDSLVLTRCADDEVWALRDDQLRHYTATGRHDHRLRDPREYARLAAEVFGVPALPIDEARRLLAARG